MTASLGNLAALADRIGAKNILVGDAIPAGAVEDWRGRYRGQARALLRPRSTADVSAIVAHCQRHRIAIVPQGGNTGVCGGAIPDSSGQAVVLSLSAMNRVRSVDPIDNVITVDAGAVLANVQAEAERHDRLFPLDLGSAGTCQIGGAVSTNAGGTSVLRYGNMRTLVRGLEVVLPDGEVLDMLRPLRKDNAGYDLKQMFIGAEGTLGIVTGAALSLFPRPVRQVTAFVALDSPEAALTLFERLYGAMGSRLTACELMSHAQVAAVVDHVAKARFPLAAPAPWYVLLEVSDESDLGDLGGWVEETLADLAQRDILSDAVLAQSEREREALWQIRHSVSEANVRSGLVRSHDTSVPSSRVAEFIRRCDAGLADFGSGLKLHHVGHLGDGNIHVVAIFEDADIAATAGARVTEHIHDVAQDLGGSIAAEHGVGQSLRDQLPRYRPAAEIALMRQIKACLDPAGLMNPDKVLSSG